MFDKEKFRENQELESTGYAVGHTHRELKERCLILMRFLEVRKVCSTGLTAEELAEEMDWIEELEIARELYSGIMSIAHGKKLCCDYSRKVLDYGYSKSSIKLAGLDEWAEEDAFDAVKYILINFTEWMKRQGKEER